MIRVGRKESHFVDDRRKPLGHDRQYDLVRVALQHVDFVGAVRPDIDRMNAERRPLGLQNSAQVIQALIDSARDDHRIDSRIGEHFFEVRDNANSIDCGMFADRQQRSRPSDDLMSPGCP